MPLAAVKLCEAATENGVVLIPYRLDRGPRLRHLRIVIDDSDEVILKAPKRVSDRQAVRFLNENADWVVERLRQREPLPTLWDHLEKQPKVSIHGRWRSLRLQFRSARSALDWSDPREVIIRLEPWTDRESQLLWAFREIARHVLPERVEQLAARHGLRVHGVRVRDQRSRWGSCSETGGLSLNWRLILLPPRIQDHVILHELAHLRHFNHSAQFYRLLQRFDPQADKHSKALNACSHHVMRLGRKRFAQA